MPIQIPATSFVMFAHLIGMGGSTSDATWHFSERDTHHTEAMINGVRQIESTESCLAFARAEAHRMSLGDSQEVVSGPITFLQFAQSISFTCAQIAPAAALITVKGPEAVLRSNGYSFTADQ